MTIVPPGCSLRSSYIVPLAQILLRRCCHHPLCCTTSGAGGLPAPSHGDEDFQWQFPAMPQQLSALALARNFWKAPPPSFRNDSPLPRVDNHDCPGKMSFTLVSKTALTR